MGVKGLEQATGLPRGRHLQLCPQAAREAVVRHARGRDLPRGDQAPNVLAVCVLAKGIELDTTMREANGVLQRAGRFGVRGEAGQHVAEAVAMGLAGLVDPLPVQSRQQLAVAQIDGLLQPPLPDEPLELPGVHEHVVADEPDRVARRHEGALARRAECVPDGDKLGSQALARARVEHIGPEATGHLRTRMHARMESEPAKQRACPPALGHRQRDPF